MTNDTLLESSYALILESAKKLANLQQLSFFLQNPVKKKMSKNDNICIFKKPLTMPFQICKILNNLIFNQEKLKMCKFFLTGYMQIICKNFFEKLVQSVSFCHRISKKLKIIKIQQLTVGLNKDLVCYRKKVVIQMQCA